jgi:MFS family permease
VLSDPVDASRSPRSRLSRPVAFAAVATILLAFTTASGVPSPLYVVYQQEWHFSASTLTAVFAIYVFGLLGSLLVFGKLSDHLGRRPVLAAAIALQGCALVLFLVAGDVTALAAARITQGVATGVALTTLGAALVDLNPPHTPTRAGVVNGVVPVAGLGIGALGCGALVQFAPDPTRLVYVLLLVAFVLATVAVARMPETSARRDGALTSLRPRVGVPTPVRLEFYALIPILVASWALGGLYLALGPSVAASVFDLRSHLVGGLVVALLCGIAAATAFLLRAWPVDRLIRSAASLLAAGMLITLAGVQTTSPVLAGIGTLVAGVGFGASSLGFFGALAPMAAPHERGELFAVAYVIAYLAFSVPALAAGFASTSAGLRPTTLVYGVVVVLLSLAALVARRAPALRRAEG